MDYPSPDGPPPDLLRSGERGENGIDIRGHGLVLVDLFLCLLKILSFRNQSDIGAVLSVVNGRKLNDLLAGPVLPLSPSSATLQMKISPSSVVATS